MSSPRIQAWMLARIDGVMHAVYGRRKRQLFSHLPRRVVEVGPGAGANFRYYPPGTAVVAVEPNPAAHPRLAARAQKYGLKLELVAEPIEGAGLRDGEAAVVVATLVLCSVENPALAVGHIWRALEPGGRLLAIEHVRAAERTLTRRLQHWVAGCWPRWFNNCHVDRDTAAVIRAAGFSDVQVASFHVGPALLPFAPHIAVTATR